MLHKIGYLDLVLILLINIIIGTIGYRYIEDLDWIDAFTNTCLIMSTMGPRYDAKKTKGKIFTSFFALYSGLIFIAVFGVILNKLILFRLD